MPPVTAQVMMTLRFSAAIGQPPIGLLTTTSAVTGQFERKSFSAGEIGRLIHSQATSWRGSIVTTINREDEAVTGQRPSFREFRKRLVARSHLIGTFIKTPTSHATEILGSLGFDFVVFDQEHAPLDAGALDMMILAARASNIAGIVRVPEASPSMIQTVLDCGATGVLVPHVTTAETARRIAQCLPLQRRLARLREHDARRRFRRDDILPSTSEARIAKSSAWR